MSHNKDMVHEEENTTHDSSLPYRKKFLRRNMLTKKSIVLQHVLQTNMYRELIQLISSYDVKCRFM